MMRLDMRTERRLVSRTSLNCSTRASRVLARSSSISAITLRRCCSCAMPKLARSALVRVF
eukprot:4892628-Prymnesium_polylepis.1